MKINATNARRARSLNSLSGLAAGMELLEQRALFTAVTWDGGAGDNLWNSPTNWSNDVVPGSSDDVTIDVAANPTIRFLSTDRTVNSLVSRETIQFEGAKLTVNTTANYDGAGAVLRLQGGTLQGGAYSFTNGATVATTSSSGTLTNVALGTELLLNTTSANVVITGTTTFTAARLQANAVNLYFAPGYTLNSLISAEGAAAGGRTVVMAYGGSGTMTIGPSGVIRLAAGSGGDLAVNNSSAATLINNGQISVEATGRSLNIQNTTLTNNLSMSVSAGTLNISPTNWSNAAAGTISATSGTVLRFAGAWSDAGAVSINASTLSLEGTFSTSGINFPGFTRTGGTVNLVGVMTNTASTLALNAATGSWTMFGGAITGGSVTYAGGSTLLTTSSGGTLTNVAVAGDLLMNVTSSYFIIGGTTSFTAARLQANATNLYINPGYTLNSLVVAEGAVAGVRTVTFAYNGSGTVTIGASGVIRLDSTSAGDLNLNNSSAATIINNGLISAEAVGRTLTIQNTTFTNNQTVQVTAGTLNISPTNWSNAAGGTISATGGSVLKFQGAWSDAGTVTVNASTLSLEGTFSTSGFNIAGLTRTGGTVNLVGVMTNTASVLNLNAATGSWNLLGGTINGGSVNSAGGSTLIATTSGGTLTNVAISGDLILNATSSSILITGTTAFTAARLQGNNTNLYFAPGYTLNSLIVAEGAAAGNRVITMAYGGVGSFTIGAAGIVRVAAGAGGGLNMQNSSVSTLINNGLISNEASGVTLTIQNSTFTNAATGTVQALAGFVNIAPTNWTNAGTLKVATGGEIDFGGTFDATGGVGTLTNTGTGVFAVTGVITNTGNTVTLNATTGSWTMKGGTINNGTVNTTGGANLLMTTSGGALNSVTIGGELIFSITSSDILLGGTTTFTAARMQANNSNIYMSPGTIMNSLISIEGAAAGNRVITLAYGGVGTITFGPLAIVRVAAGSAAGVTIQNSSVATLINNGLISNEAAGQTLTIQPSNFTNNASGTVQALAGAVTLNATNYTNAGTFKVADGAVLNLDGGFNVSAGLGNFVNTGAGVTNVTGNITNTGNTITLNATTGSWTMKGGSITNGSLSLTGGTNLLTTPSGGTLTSLAISGELLLTVTSSYVILGGNTTFNAARLQGNNTTIYMMPGSTLNSLVSVEGATAGNRSMVLAYGGVGTVTFGTSAIVRLASGVGGSLSIQNSSAATLINNGLITCEAAGQTLTIQPSTFTNNATGIVQSLAGTLVINATNWTNAGTGKVATGAALNLDGTFIASGGIGTFINLGTGVTNVAGNITNTGNTITLNATTGSWTMKGGTINNGSLNLTAGTNLLTTSSGGTLNSLAITGELLLNVTSAYVILGGTTTFNAARLQGNNTTIYMAPGSTLNSLVSVEGATAGNRSIVLAYGGAGTVTFGTSAIVRLASGVGGSLSLQNSSAATLINNGLITNEAAGQTLTIQPTTFTNTATGVVQALAGTLTVNATTWTNAGTLKVATGAILAVDGNFDATGGIGTFINTGTGTTRIAGTVTNTGKTIALTAATGSWTMFGGAIVNGAVTSAGGSTILGGTGGGTLNNVAITGEVLISTTSGYVILTGTTTFTALRLQGNNTNVYMQPGYTLNNLISIEGATAGGRSVVLAYGGAGTNTISATGIIRVAAGAGGSLSIQNSSVATLINNGVIEGFQNGATITIQNSFFTNNGTVNGAGSPVNITSSISNISAGTLSGGVWKASAGGSLTGSANLVKVLAVNVTLDGATTGWNALGKLETINAGVTFTLGSTTDQAVAPATGTFTNNGTLILGLGSRLAITGNFVQTAGALLRILTQGGNPNTTYGSVTATGTGSLAGSLQIVAVNGYIPQRPDTDDIIVTNGVCTGSFSSATWPQTDNPEWKTYFYYTGHGAQLITTSIIDFNIDGQIDLQDFFEFFNRWDVQDPTLDLNNDGGVDLGDYFLFFNLFDQG